MRPSYQRDVEYTSPTAARLHSASDTPAPLLQVRCQMMDEGNVVLEPGGGGVILGTNHILGGRAVEASPVRGIVNLWLRGNGWIDMQP